MDTPNHTTTPNMPDATIQSSAADTATVSSHDGLMDLVQSAISQNAAIIDYGRAHADMGNPPPDDRKQIHLNYHAANAPIIDHYDRDMTVRVHAGATVGDINNALKPSNQYVPIDADPDLTIAEIINANIYGPTRLSLGGIRDLLLGLHYIDGKARDIHVGGRTVKNVAGLDVTRLMVGSLGQLGLIHQATLRTYAIPEQVLLVDLSIDDPATLDRCLTTWILTDACPAAMLLELCPAGWCLRIAYQGSASACASQLHSLQSFIETQQGLHIKGSATSLLDQDFAEHTARRSWQRHAPAVVKIIVPPACTGNAAKQLQAFSQEHTSLNIWALPAHGCIVTGGDLAPPQTHALEQLATQITQSVNGLRSWVRRPQQCTQTIQPFSPLPDSMELLIKLKTTLDPHHLFNPGRLIPREAAASDFS